MKHILVGLLLLVAGSVSAQQMVQVKPYLSTVVVDSVVVTAGSDTLLFSGIDAQDADSAVVGQYIFGPGIPYGTKIATVISDSLLEMDEDALVTTALATIAFTDFVDSSYAIGDVVGTPVSIPKNWTMIHRIEIVDVDDVQDSLYAYIFDGEANYDVDNTAFSPADSDAINIVAYINLCTSVDVGASKIMYTPMVATPIIIKRNEGGYWLTLVAGGAQDNTSQQPLTIILWGE